MVTQDGDDSHVEIDALFLSLALAPRWRYWTGVCEFSSSLMSVAMSPRTGRWEGKGVIGLPVAFTSS